MASNVIIVPTIIMAYITINATINANIIINEHTLKTLQKIGQSKYTLMENGIRRGESKKGASRVNVESKNRTLKLYTRLLPK